MLNLNISAQQEGVRIYQISEARIILICQNSLSEEDFNLSQIDQCFLTHLTLILAGLSYSVN